MRIVIDGDGCPVINMAIEAAKKYNIECIILCDTSHIINRNGAKTVTVSKGADSVDFAIVNMIDSDDIVVTQDYGLAAMCLSRKATTLNQNGLVYDDSNIDSLLFSRYTAKNIRRSGGRLKGPKKRTSEQDKAFLKSLEEILSKKTSIITGDNNG